MFYVNYADLVNKDKKSFKKVIVMYTESNGKDTAFKGRKRRDYAFPEVNTTIHLWQS